MKTISSEYKAQIKSIGKEIDSKITYGETELGSETLNSITPSYEGGILKTVMKQLDIDSDIDIPLNTEINYKFGVKVNDTYEYLDFGNYIVYSSEYNADTQSYQIVAYDKMLYSMIDYTTPAITYPCTVRDYLTGICNRLGITFANSEDEFANYEKSIPSELYLDENGNSLDYTFRDVLEDLAEVTASTICINNDDELEIRYITDTEEEIDEESLKNINVSFGKKYGPVNSVVLSRSADSDNVYLQDSTSVETNGLCEIKIKDNQIMNDNNRSDFLQDILDKVNGIEFYINDYSSTGITYLELCDKYSVKVYDNTYNCVMFNDEIIVNNGLTENIYTDEPEISETDYKKADSTDKKINQAYIIVDKQLSEIESRVKTIEDNNEGERINSLEGRMTSTEGTLNVISTNIDKTTGEIKEVTTTTGFTFNKDGLSIEKTGEPTKSNIDEAGIEVQDATSSSNEVQLYAGYVTDEKIADESALTNYKDQTVTYSKNVIFKNYLATTNGRMENVTNSTYGSGIGFFV